MAYRIRSVRLQGIRGFNKPEEIALSEGITVLHGQNGSGKSSILQAIEWGVTGVIPSMKGGDFTREDAIVNLFTPSKKASVEISLGDSGQPIAIQRTRKRGTKTATGKQPLEVKVGDQFYQDDEAAVELEKVLGLSLDEFSKTKYLHQETIREVLEAKPEERSQAIDKLLGTFQVREFANTINVDRGIKASVKRLNETAESIRREKILFVQNLRRALDETRAGLLGKGFKEDDLTLSAAFRGIEDAKTGVIELVTRFKAKPQSIQGGQLNSESLSETNRALTSQLNALDRTRLEEVARIQKRKLHIQVSAKRYGEVYIRLGTMKNSNEAEAESSIAALEEELSGMLAKMRALNEKITVLPHIRSAYIDASSKIEEAQGAISAINTDYGSQEEMYSKIIQSREEQRRIQAELSKLSSQQRLIALAIDQLKLTKAQTCPVCSQGIDNEELVKSLQTSVNQDLQKTAQELHAQEKAVKNNEKTLEEKKGELETLTKSMANLEQAFAKSKLALEAIIPCFEALDLEEVSKGWRTELAGLSGEETGLRSRISELREAQSQLKQLKAELNQLGDELQNETSSKAEGQSLVEEAEKLVAALDSDIIVYSDSSQVDTIRDKLQRLSDTISYLKEEEKLEAAEKELPVIEEQIRALGERTASLQALGGSLESIRQIAAEYGKEASLKQLERLEDEINGYYSTIQGHPYFTRLKFDIEKEDPLIYSIKAISDQEATYIPTRFSTAQLNATALSIFISNASQQTGNLPLMFLDDPTQSMDPAHKETFAKLIANLTPRLQIIVATEDDETKSLLEKHCKGIKTYELGEWTPEGPEIKAE